MRAANWQGLLVASLIGVASVAPAAAGAAPLPVRVMIVATFADEAQVWLDSRKLDRAMPVPGLPDEYPAVHCGADRVCLVTVGEGHANAAASIAALAFSRRFDLRHTYWLIAGIAGINPERGTLGSAAWARYLVEWGLQWELDAREKPPDWPTGLTGVETRGPWQKPVLQYGTEVFRLDEDLLQRALTLSRSVELADSAAAQATRAAYPPPANRPPTVIQCDSLSGDIWWSGRHLAGRRRPGPASSPTARAATAPRSRRTTPPTRRCAARTPRTWLTPAALRCCAPAPTSTGRRQAPALSATSWTSPTRAGSRRPCRTWCVRAVPWWMRS